MQTVNKHPTISHVHNSRYLVNKVLLALSSAWLVNFFFKTVCTYEKQTVLWPPDRGKGYAEHMKEERLKLIIKQSYSNRLCLNKIKYVHYMKHKRYNLGSDLT